jgi:hypothetical protein
MRSVGLGLLLQRAAGVPAPDPDAWESLINRLLASISRTASENRESSP